MNKLLLRSYYLGLWEFYLFAHATFTSALVQIILMQKHVYLLYDLNVIAIFQVSKLQIG